MDSYQDPYASFFNWSGGNTDSARQVGAKNLSQFIDCWKNYHPDDPIRIIAHSHGGNVALLTSQNTQIDELVTLGTPILNNYQPGFITNWFNIYSINDHVQTLPWGAKRSHPRAINIRLKGYGHSDLHTIDAWISAFPWIWDDASYMN
jgi:hypothetical protein